LFSYSLFSRKTDVVECEYFVILINKYLTPLIKRGGKCFFQN
jgi:hypothetical protein